MRRSAIILTMLASLFLLVQAASAEGVSTEYVNNTFKAVYHDDRTVTVEGTSEKNAGQSMRIMVQGPRGKVSFSKDYQVQADSKGYFKLVTEPLAVNSVNVFIYTNDNYSYYLGVRASEELNPRPQEATMTTLKNGDPALQNTVSPDSIAAIKQKWSQYAPVFNYDKESPYVQMPVLKSPYEAGALKEQVLQDALNATKFMRYLTGLSENITLDPSLSQAAQHKVVVLEKTYNSKDPHNPAKPADMEDSFYQTAKLNAYENLHYGYDPAGAVISFMDDRGDNNRYSLGHRRAILMPDLQAVGFGMTSKYTVMRLSIPFPQQMETPDYIAWPAAGNFPMEMSGFEMISVQLNPERFAPIDPETFRIEVVSKGQKKKWRLYETGSYSSDNGMILFSEQRHPNGNAPFISFKPEGLSFKAGDEIKITITGLQSKDGQDASIEYTTHFFNLDEKKDRQTGTGTTGGTGNNGGLEVVLEKPEASPYKNASTWALAELENADKNGLVSPVSKLDFRQAITREQFSAVVVKFYEALTGKALPEAADNPFADTANPEVLKAYSLGIVNGVSSQRFAPKQPISREEIAVMLNRALQKGKPDFKPEHASEKAAFADAGKISSWATGAVETLRALSVVQGDADNLFKPKSSTTVEQACIMVYRLLERML
ncbi:S-layer homology domain-containing protein [Paenibacillus sp. GCM10027626]|uniref:CAP and S-layer homology domain-containing protein n=1 Tax=Paenibacillus sp. GCM10027626 TaxID=3273411 RepID=UPI0036439852